MSTLRVNTIQEADGTAFTRVVQVVNAVHSTQLELNDTTVTDTGLTADITMTSASNKVLILICQQMS